MVRNRHPLLKQTDIAEETNAKNDLKCLKLRRYKMNIRCMVLSILILAGLPAPAAYTADPPQFGSHTREQFQDYWYNHGAEVS